MEKITYVNLLLIDGDRVLMQLRDEKPEIFAPGVWAIPGGKVDEGEDPEVAIKREYLEETDYITMPKYFDTYLYDFMDGNPLTAFYYDKYDGESVVNCHEGQKMEFLTLEEIKSLDVFPIHEKVVSDLFQYLEDQMADVSVTNLDEDDLDALEDKLLEEEFEDRKEEMAVSGRSVFEIQRLKQEERPIKEETTRSNTDK